MQKITITRSFRFVDLWETHGCEYAPGDYAVVERPAAPNECSPRCAEVALAEGWAVRAGGDSQVTDGRQTSDAQVTKQTAEAEKVEARPTGSPTGKAAPSASSRPVSRSRKRKPTK